MGLARLCGHSLPAASGEGKLSSSNGNSCDWSQIHRGCGMESCQRLMQKLGRLEIELVLHARIVNLASLSYKDNTETHPEGLALWDSPVSGLQRETQAALCSLLLAMMLCMVQMLHQVVYPML